VATIAIRYRVDPVAPQAYEILILTLQVKVNWGDGKAAMNSRLLTVLTAFSIMGSNQLRTGHQCCANNRSECQGDSYRFQ